MKYSSSQYKVARYALLFNIITPFSLGTFVYLCFFTPKERVFEINATCLVGLTVFAYVPLAIHLILIAPHPWDPTYVWLIIAITLLTITYIWGITFAGILMRKIRYHRLGIANQLNSPERAQIRNQVVPA
jgi:O-antigen/teichoic acid export membrane protein